MSPPDPTPARFSTRFIARIAVGLSITFGVVSLGAALILPGIIEAQLRGFVEDRVGFPPTIERVVLNPFRLRLMIQGFEIREPEASEAILAFDEFAIDLRLLGFLAAHVAIEEIVLEAPRVLAEWSEAGELNILGLLGDDIRDDVGSDAGSRDSEDSESTWVVDIASIRIEEGSLLFRDFRRNPVFETEVAPLNFALSDLTTRVGEAASFSLALRFANSAEFDWRGTLGVNPVQLDGQIELHNFDLSVAWTYLSEELQFEITDGLLDLAATLDLEMIDGLSISVTDARVDLKNFDLIDRANGSSVIAMPSTRLGGIDVKASEHGLETLRIASVLVDGGQVRSHRESDGRIHLGELFRSDLASKDGVEESPGDAMSSARVVAARAVATDSAVAERHPPTIRLDRLEFRNFGIDFEDRVPASPVPIRLSAIQLEITGFENSPDNAFDLVFESKLNAAGRIEVTGKLGVDPLAASLAIRGTDVFLGDFQSYLDSFVALELTQGTLATALDFSIAKTDSEVSLAGRIQIDDLMAIDRHDSEKVIAWEVLKIEGLMYSGKKLQVEQVALSSASVDLIRSVEGRLNLDSALNSDPSPTPPASPSSRIPSQHREESSSPESSLAIHVDRVTVTDFGFAFQDFSVEPAFVLNLGSLSGEIVGLSSDELARADLEFEGLIDEVAPIRLVGSINPLATNAFTDLKVTVSGVSMPGFDSYASKFAGYSIDRGKLDLDLVYRLEAGELEAENHIALRKFEFGDAVESEEATALPVSLAVALMRDGAGDINLDLPIRGRVDDPNFSVFRLLGRAFVNLIGKAATAPFTFLSGAISRSPEGLASVAFSPGSDRLTSSEGRELAVLGDALAERPRLRLEVRGRADPDLDGPALRRSKIEQEIQSAIFEGLSASEQARLGDANAVDVDPARRLGELEKMYAARVGGQPGNLLSAQPSETDAMRTRRLSDAVLASLASQVELAESDWRALAKARALRVQSALVRGAEIEHGRIFLVDVEIGPVSDAGLVPTGLSLAAE